MRGFEIAPKLMNFLKSIDETPIQQEYLKKMRCFCYNMDQNKVIDGSVTLDVLQPKLNKLYLVCSINSKEPFTDPETIQTDFITQKSETLLALKIPKLFAYIGLAGTKAIQNKQHEELPNQLLSCFRLLDADTDNNEFSKIYFLEIIKNQQNLQKLSITQLVDIWMVEQYKNRYQHNEQ